MDAIQSGPALELSRKPKILIVEDERIIAEDLKRRIAGFGFEVTATVRSGEEALRAAEGCCPDLVLMDIALAGPMSGTAAAELIGTRWHTPVIYLTAHTEAKTLGRVKNTEPYGFLTKPYQPEQLRTVIELALTRRKEEDKRNASQQASASAYGELQESVRQFTYSAGHDLQEPLRTVSSFVNLLYKRMETRLDTKERAIMTEIQAGVARMKILLQDLLAYAQAGGDANFVVKPISADHVLSQVLANLQLAIDESGAVIDHAPLPDVIADAAQLGQVFQNLLSNAIKYRKPSEAPRIHIGIEKGVGQWVFSVRDNGLGFDAEYCERILLPFHRLHARSEYQGTGIGLAICKKIIEAHGGRMWVESKPDKGSTFYFTIPAAHS